MTQSFRAALDLAHDRGRSLRFWLRDDDATRPGPALAHLLTLCAGRDAPATLAVIPAYVQADLAPALPAGTRVALHGWAHENHAPPGEKKQELGAHRPAGQVLAQLAQGHRHLRALFPGHLIDLLVPPWNRIAPDVIAGLPGIGIRALSAFGKVTAATLPVLNPDIDPVDWHGTRSLRDPDRLWHELTQAALRDIDTGRPIGILTHHLDHDAAIWGFLDRLMALTDHPACRWVAPDDILPELPRAS
ncbi:polysaccharide deacetylase family protein [Paracoccus sp. (in: a-proteobacteria)]|uniref:polysaccharide deacetylase family protein n=1 Tax=Paracoccus sp. TaxID=267 RepID=UPI0035B49382